MDTHDIPKLTTLQTGNTFKVYEVTGSAGLEMPLHYATGEAVVVVQEGSAVLTMDGTEHRLEAGSFFIIPARKNHHLELKTRFKALVTMGVDADIEFVNQ